MPEKKKHVVPRLRFPKFSDSGEWEVKRLGEVISLEYGAALPEDQRIEGPFPVVGSNGIVGYHNEHLVDGPAIVIGRKGSAGQVNWIEDACYPIDTTYYVVLKNTEDHLRFFRLLLEHHRLSDIVSPGGVPGLNRDDVYSVISAIPVPAEQQKIADCLGSLDDLIRAEEAALEALKKHKKGLMQQLFPHEGETTPRLRFPEYRDAGEWEVKRLGEVCEINNGSSNAQDHVDAGKYPLFDRSLTVKRSNNYLFDCEAVIVPGEGSEFSPRYYKGKFDLHQRAYALTQFNAVGKFVFFLMDRWKAQLAGRAVMSTVLSLRMPILENYRITIPSKPEQQKIADFLSSLDDLIRAKGEKIEALKQHKKGLMQQLFPQEID